MHLQNVTPRDNEAPALLSAYQMLNPVLLTTCLVAYTNSPNTKLNLLQAEVGLTAEIFRFPFR